MVDNSRKLKTKIHFNRVNMSRKDIRVWSAHNGRHCYMSEKIVVVHEGKKLLETVFNQGGRQPRAYLVGSARVRRENGVTIVEV